MKKAKKPLLEVPKNEKIIGAGGGNQLLNPNNRVTQKSLKKKETILQSFINIFK